MSFKSILLQKLSRLNGRSKFQLYGFGLCDINFDEHFVYLVQMSKENVVYL